MTLIVSGVNNRVAHESEFHFSTACVVCLLVSNIVPNGHYVKHSSNSFS